MHALSNRFPDFLGIGVQKAGTTWLDRALRNHPQIWLPPFKELHYFNGLHIRKHQNFAARGRTARAKAILDRYLARNAPHRRDQEYLTYLQQLIQGPTTDAWYARIFSLASPDQICGEITPDYAELPDNGIKHVLRVMPQVKIILSLRDPIERAWSHARMLAANNDIIDAEGIERIALGNAVFERGLYPQVIARWRAQVPREQFCIIFLDQIAGRPKRVLERVCKFLDVGFNNEYFPDAEERKHAGISAPIPPAIYATLKEKFRDTYDDLSKMFPAVCAGWKERHFS